MRLAAEGPRSRSREKVLLGECAHVEVSRPSNNHVHTLHYTTSTLIFLEKKKVKEKKKIGKQTRSPRKFVAAAAAPRGKTITTTLLPVYNV